MAEEDGLICAYILDGQGGGREIGWREIEAWTPDAGVLWVHLLRDSDPARSWLHDKSGLGPIRVEALLETETRPRSVPLPEGLLTILRGVNLNPGSDPEDMVGLRIWVEKDRVISVRQRQVMAINDLRDSIGRGRGPRSSGTLLAAIANYLTVRIGPVIETLEDRVDELEDEILTAETREARGRLQDIRRETIKLRRYLFPQRDALSQIATEDFDWLDRISKARLREAGDRTIRYVEDLDEVRERGGVVQDELMNRLAERTNRTMYALTVIASIMLPLSFVTGLLGINVGGIPGAENKSAFLIVIGLLIVLALGQIWMFRRLKWI